MLIDEAVIAKLRSSSRSRRCTSPTISPASRRRSRPFPERRRSRASTRRSTARHPFVADTFALPRSLLRRGRAALRVPRPVLRIHHADAARRWRPDRARGRDRRPSRQRRLDVRDQARPVDLLDHGLHGARRPADGHALRPARSGRHAVSDRREEDERSIRSPTSSTRNSGSRACRASRRTCASSRPPTARRRATRSPISSPASGASSAASPPPSAASTASCSPAASARTPRAIRKAVLTGMDWIGIQLDDEANNANAQIISAESLADRGLRDPDRRRADDRQTHPRE